MAMLTSHQAEWDSLWNFAVSKKLWMNVFTEDFWPNGMLVMMAPYDNFYAKLGLKMGYGSATLDYF